MSNIDWTKIDKLVIYDSNMMRPSEIINDSIYSISGKEFYTPILRFCEDIKDDNVYMECYLDRVITAPKSTVFGSPVNTNEYKVRVSFNKEKFTELLTRSIGEDKYIWEDKAFQDVLKDVFSDLAAHLTNKVGHPFISTSKKYILSGGEGLITTKDGELAGCFSGLIIQPAAKEAVSTMTGRKMTMPSLKITIPKLVFNSKHFEEKNCILIYNDIASNLKISTPMSSIARAGLFDAPYTTQIGNATFDKVAPMAHLAIPNEDYSILMNKTLVIPVTKFEKRLLAIMAVPACKKVERASVFTQELNARFKRLVKE